MGTLMYSGRVEDCPVDDVGAGDGGNTVGLPRERLKRGMIGGDFGDVDCCELVDDAGAYGGSKALYSFLEFTIGALLPLEWLATAMHWLIWLYSQVEAISSTAFSGKVWTNLLAIG
jgi:hypothetical protein